MDTMDKSSKGIKCRGPFTIRGARSLQQLDRSFNLGPVKANHSLMLADLQAPSRNDVVTFRKSPNVQRVGDTDSIQDIENWLDTVTFTSRRPRQMHFHRDFSDGVLVAEIIHHFLPSMIDPHNYIPVNSVDHKRINWKTLNRKVFLKLNMTLSNAQIDEIANSVPGGIESLLKCLRVRIEKELSMRSSRDEQSKALAAACISGNNETTTEVTCVLHQPQLSSTAKTHNPDKVNSSRYITYEDIKYVPANDIESLELAISNLRTVQLGLESKIKQLELLVGMKDTHLEDLTMQLHRSKTKGKNCH